MLKANPVNFSELKKPSHTLELRCNRIREFVLVLEISANVLTYVQRARTTAWGDSADITVSF